MCFNLRAAFLDIAPPAGERAGGDIGVDGVLGVAGALVGEEGGVTITGVAGDGVGGVGSGK